MSMDHLFIKGKKDETIVLFHGTGGNKNDLLEIGKYIEKDANFLGLNGNILEGSLRRFFKRNENGLDVENMIEETNIIISELKKFSEKYDFDYNKMNAIGYSNGANMIVSLLFEKEDIFNKVILLNPMYPRENEKNINLKNLEMFISMGLNDSIIPKDSAEKLVEVLKSNEAETTVFEHYFGHQINMKIVEEAKRFYNK